MLDLLLAFLAFAPQATSPPKIDIARARRVFENNCAACHGPRGEGGRGPNLTVPKLRRARNDEELAGVIVGGVPGTEMPASWHLGTEGVTQVIAYLHVLRANATPPPVAGDAANGKALFEGKGGCAGCHTVNGQGRPYGPELSDIGARRTEESLRQSLEEPSAEVAESFLLVHAVTRQGAKVTGIRLNEDTFTIQVLEPSGKVASFRKADLAKLEKRPGESPMPSYKTVFSANELQDLIAYLSSLRGEQ
jgi:putative heme-binding domain-containing protein